MIYAPHMNKRTTKVIDNNTDLTHKYKLYYQNGEPVDSKGIYFVLKLNSDDPIHSNASIAAAEVYAKCIKKEYPLLSSSLNGMCINCRGSKKHELTVWQLLKQLLKQYLINKIKGNKK